MSEEDVPLAS